MFGHVEPASFLEVALLALLLTTVPSARFLIALANESERVSEAVSGPPFLDLVTGKRQPMTSVTKEATWDCDTSRV